MVKADVGLGKKERITPSFSRSCMDAIESTMALSGMYSSKSDFLLSAIRNFQAMVSEDLVDKIEEWRSMGLSTEDMVTRADSHFSQVVKYYNAEYARTYPGPSKEQITAFIPPVIFGHSLDFLVVKEEMENCAKAAIFIMLEAVVQDTKIVSDVWSVRFYNLDEDQTLDDDSFQSRRIRF